MKHIRSIYRSGFWQTGIGMAVLANAIVLGLIAEGRPDTITEYRLELADQGLLALLVADAMLCILVRGRAVWRSGWDMFDIGVTLISVVPSFGTFSTFRVLRTVRVLRLISFIPNSRAMVDAMLGALRNMAAAFVVLGVVFYSFVVIVTSLFHVIDPAHYGTLARSAAHLYTVMVTLGSGLDSEIVFDDRPWVLPIYGAFIVVASFGLMNMFIAVLVAALREELEKDTIQEERARFDRLERQIAALTVLVRTQRSDDRARLDQADIDHPAQLPL